MELDQLNRATTTATALWDQTILYLPSLLSGIVILLIGLFVAHWLAGAVGRALGRSIRLDPTMRTPIVAIVKYLIVIMTLIIALGQMGVQMTSLLAVLGAAGLAVGLALQGTLSNIAAGIMLLWLRPFRVGDYVETAAYSGTVREIGLFAAHLETFDGLFVFAPNSTLWNVWLRNHSRAAARTLAWTVTLPRDVPFAQARALLESAWPDGSVPSLKNPHVFLDQLTETAQILVLRGEVSEGSIALAQRQTAERVRELFAGRFGSDGEPRGIQRLLPADGDPSRYMNRSEAPKANPTFVNHRPEAPRQGTASNPPEAAGSA